MVRATRWSLAGPHVDRGGHADQEHAAQLLPTNRLDQTASYEQAALVVNNCDCQEYTFAAECSDRRGHGLDKDVTFVSVDAADDVNAG